MNFLRFFLIQGQFSSNRARRTCKMYLVEANYSYSLKCLFKTNPGKMLALLTFTGLFLFANLLRIAESPIARFNQTTDDLFLYSNAVWTVWITMTTVGYGDYKAYTNIGRIVTFFISLYGILIVSLVVYVFQQKLQFAKLEYQSYLLLIQLRQRSSLRKKAIKIISKFAYYIYWAKHFRLFKQSSLKIIRNLISKFKDTQSHYKMLIDSRNMLETSIPTNFMNLQEKTQLLVEQQKKCFKNIKKLLDNVILQQIQNNFNVGTISSRNI